MHKNKMKSIIESLLFVWGEPLSIQDISKITHIQNKEIVKLLDEMIEHYENSPDKGILIKEYNHKYQFTTKKENFNYVQSLFQTNERKTLSNAALETISIIAYKQPVSKVEIESIRGVKCSYIIRSLIDKGLIEEVGKLDKPGKPSIYGTTDEFLRHFGLKSINELPDANFENYEEGEEKIT